MAYVREYKDDPSIRDQDDLWRRIQPEWIIFDEALGRNRPSSAAFQDSSDGTAMSVDLAKLRSGTAEALASYPGHGLASFTAGFARRDCRQGVDHTPEEGGYDAHASVWGDKPKSVRNRFAKAANLIGRPSAPTAAPAP
jgi:hypothetical protein